MALKNNQGLAQANAEQDQDKTTEGQVLDLNFEAGEDNGEVLTMMTLTRILMGQVFCLNHRNLTKARWT